jgi:hypothetical protein
VGKKILLSCGLYTSLFDKPMEKRILFVRFFFGDSVTLDAVELALRRIAVRMTKGLQVDGATNVIFVEGYRWRRKISTV